MKLAHPLDTLYIPPHVLLYPNLDELYKPLDGANYHLSIELNGMPEFDSLLSFKRVIVLAEPGYGKTELLKQIEKSYKPETCKHILCKNLKAKPVTDQFLASENIEAIEYVLFDALDEIEVNYVGETIKKIQQYAESNPSVTIIISCRIHYMIRFGAQFQNLEEFKFLKIVQFYDSDICKYLLYYLPDEEPAIGRIIEKTKINSYRSILSTPRYLQAFVTAIANDVIKLEDLAELKITELFDKLIYHKLEDDSKKDPSQFSKNEIELTRRVLEKISLIMEIYQTNVITKEDLITILDETVSNVNLIFLNYSSIDTFIDRVLKQTGEYLEFEHTEFQEYLAARQLIRMANKEQTLYDLILDPALQHIYPAWYDVLKFAVEMSPSIILNLTRYLAFKQNFQVDEKLIDIILSIETKDLADDEKAFLFTTLSTYYEKSGQFVGQRFHKIAQFYSPLLNSSYIEFDENDQSIKRAFTNRINIIRGIVAIGKMPMQQTQAWMQFLINRLADPKSDNTAETISFVLEAFDAFEALKSLWPKITARIDKLVQNYMITLFRMKPGDPFCLAVLQYVIEYRDNIEISDCVNMLAGKGNLSDFFDFLLSKDSILEKAFRGDSSYRAYYKLFDQIESEDDKELNTKVGQVFSKLLGSNDYYNLYRNKRQFVEHALKYFWQRETGFVDQIFKLSKASYFLSEYGNTIVEVMNFDEFSKIKDFLIAGGNDWELHTIIAKLKVLGDLDRRKLLDEIQVAYPEFFQVRNPQPFEPEVDTAKDDLIYREYQSYLLLHRTNNLVYEDLFSFVYHNWEVLSARSTDEETDQITQLLIRTLDWLDPEKFSLKIERNGNRSSYAHNMPDWFRFDLLIKLGLELGVEDVIIKHRQKIIYYLPLVDNYISNAARLGNILDIMGPITSSEVQSLIDFCLRRDDDYIYSSILTFIDLINDQKLAAFAAILALYIEDEAGKTDIGEKSKALDSYALVTKDTPEGRDYLKKLFGIHQDSVKGSPYLRQRANAHLITYYEDEDAIEWRFQQLKNNVMRVDDNVVSLSRTVSYTPAMNEMEQPTYGKCFIENPSNRLLKPMFDLLEFSFELIKQSDALRYSNYLQRIIFDYFNENKTIALINQVRAFVNEERFESRGFSFKYLLKQLEMNFIEENKNYTNISEAVQSFNELNAKRYLRIRDEADLAYLIQQVITDDIRNVIENEGFYHVAQRLAGNISFKQSGHVDEDMIQRTLKIIFENALLKRGFRAVDFYREPELLDSKRYDYLIKYGFIGPIVIELKRLDNSEITNPQKRAAYKAKIKQYLNGVNSKHGFYVIFKVDEDKGDKAIAQYEQLVKEYSDVKELYIEILDCWEPIKAILPKIEGKNKRASKKAAAKK